MPPFTGPAAGRWPIQHFVERVLLRRLIENNEFTRRGLNLVLSFDAQMRVDGAATSLLLDGGYSPLK